MGEQWDAQELRILRAKPSSLTTAAEVDDVAVDPTLQRDADALMRLGKIAVLKRNFGFVSILGFSCTVLITWEASLLLLTTGLQNGGPAGIIWGFLLVWAGTASVFAVLCELASMAPTSGGQYHWVSMMAPKSCQKSLSYVTGWITVVAWQATVSTAAYLTGPIFQGVIILTNPSYVPQAWHGLLFAWAVIFFAVFVNTSVSSLLPKFEGAILILHTLGFFAILIPLIILGPIGEPKDVFTTFLNEGHWPSQGLSLCIGLMGDVYAFVGGDAAIHMSEEIRNAQVVVPWSVMLGTLLNGILGFVMINVILIYGGSIDTALEKIPSYPFIAMIYQAVRSTTAAAVLASIVPVLAVFTVTGMLASCSRMFWSFSRDRGLPGWKRLRKISPRTSIPFNSVVATTVISCLLGLINIGSASAFNGILSISIAGLFSSYLSVAILLLWRRSKGDIKSSSDVIAQGLANTPGGPLTWGPWRIPGNWGIVNNAFACVYLVFVLFFSFWPTNINPAPSEMNWSCLVTGVIALFGTAYYLLSARKVYQGPVVEI